MCNLHDAGCLLQASGGEDAIQHRQMSVTVTFFCTEGFVTHLLFFVICYAVTITYEVHSQWSNDKTPDVAVTNLLESFHEIVNVVHFQPLNFSVHVTSSEIVCFFLNQ